VLAHSKVEDGNLMHNNVFYVDRSTVNVDYHADREKAKMDPQESAKLGLTFKNNIFYAIGQGRFLRGGSVYYRNCYFGPWKKGIPDDPEKLLADPMFVEPGAGGIGPATLAGYMLQPKSPCINAGLPVEMDSKRDFYENMVTDGKIDIGAYEQKAPKQ
jgi:hypothetical protein